MIYRTFMQNGQEICFSDFNSAVKGCEELELSYFIPFEHVFSCETAKTAFVKENGQWIEKQMSEIKCKCGGNHAS